MQTLSHCLRRALSTHGTAHQCVRNSAVPSPWSTLIGRGVGATGMTEYHKPCHAHYLQRSLRHAEKQCLCSANQVAFMHSLPADHIDPKLRRLELDVSEVTEAVMQKIFQLEAAGQLEYLSIRLHRITPTLKTLCKLPNLKELNVSGTRITDEDVLLLSECHTLVKIDLHSCRCLIDLDLLSSIETLEVINLSGCSSLTHVGALGKLPALKEVNLSETRITDEDVRLLSESKTLVKIELHSCRVLKNVAPLSSIETLEVINLSGCSSLTQVGALGKLPALKEVDLSRTFITDEDVRLLSECHTLVKIYLSWCKALTNVNPLSSIATLEVINLYGCDSLTHVGALGKLPVLKDLNLSFTRITDEELRQLSECRALVKIYLGSCRVLTNVNPLSSVEKLDEIYLSDCTSLTHVGALGKLPALKELSLSRTHITDEDVRLLSESNTVVKIDLSWCKALANVNPLSSITTLEEIDLSSCTSLARVSALGKLPKLIWLSLDRTPVMDEEVNSLNSLHEQLGLPFIEIEIGRANDDD